MFAVPRLRRVLSKIIRSAADVALFCCFAPRTTRISNDFQLLAREPVQGRRRIELVSYPHTPVGRDESGLVLRQALDLPPSSNPRSVELGRQLRARASSPADIPDLAIEHFRRSGLRYTLDPGFGALSNACDFEFMEQMVVKFSDQGTEQTSLSSKFSTFSGRSPSGASVITASKDVLNPNPASTFKPQIINDNGKWIVLDPEALGGNSVEQATAQQKMKSAASLNEQVIRASFGNDKNTSKDSLSSSLFELLNKVGKVKTL